MLQQVAEWWKCSGDRALEMREGEPALFRWIVDAIHVEREAEPVARKHAQAKAEIEEKRKKQSQGRARLHRPED